MLKLLQLVVEVANDESKKEGRNWASSTKEMIIWFWPITPGRTLWAATRAGNVVLV